MEISYFQSNHKNQMESIFQKNPGRAEFTMEKLLVDAKDRLLIRLPKDLQERTKSNKKNEN